MKFTCQQSVIMPRLLEAANLASHNSPDSQHRTLEISAKSGRIELRAASLAATSQHLAAGVPARVERPGSVSVDARLMADLLATQAHTPDIEMKTSRNRHQLHITAGDCRANLITRPAPVQEPTMTGASSALLNPAELRGCLEACLPAASTSVDQRTMNGVKLQLDARGLTLAATDGFRMAIARRASPQVDATPHSIIIPLNAARDLAKSAADATGPIALEATEDMARFTVPQRSDTWCRITTRLTVGHFPDPYGLIPEIGPTKAVIHPATTAAAARMAASFAGRFTPLLLYLHYRQTRDSQLIPSLTMAARTLEEDETVQTLPLMSLTGDPANAAVNARFLVQALHPLRHEERAALELNGPEGPAVIRNEDASELTQISMIMPICVRWESIRPPEVTLPKNHPPDTGGRRRRRIQYRKKDS